MKDIIITIGRFKTSFYLVLILLFTTLAGCEKKDLNEELIANNPAPKPIFYLQGEVGNTSIYYALGDSVYKGITSVFRLPNILNTYSFDIINKSDSTIGYFAIDINGHALGVSNRKEDLIKSITTSQYPFAYKVPDPTNPAELKCVEILMPRGQRMYSSRVVKQFKQFTIVQTEDLVKDGLFYRAASLTFECRLGNITDTTDVIEFKNGKARLLFGGIPE